MQWNPSQNMNLGNRLLHWVAGNQKQIFFTLCGGILFFALLGLVTYWQNKKETDALTSLYLAKQDPAALQKVAQEYPKQKAAAIALADIGSTQLAEKNFDACIATYEKLYEKVHYPYWRVLALHGVGTCWRGKKDYKKAAEFFDRAAKEPGNEAKVLSRFEALVSLQKAGDPLAKAGFQELLNAKDLPNDLRDKIKEKILWLESQPPS